MMSDKSLKARRPRGTRRRSDRRGATAVEFALTAPILFLLLFGGLELGHANMVLNLAEAAAYEGAREGIVPGANAAECVAASQRLLQSSRIRDAVVTVEPANLSADSEFVTVTINVPYERNTLSPPFFTRGLVVERECQLTREQD